MTTENPQKTRKKPATRRKAQPKIQADAKTIRRALDDLGIDRPYYTARVVSGRLELRLYGGDYVYWPPDPVQTPGSGVSPKET